MSKKQQKFFDLILSIIFSLFIAQIIYWIPVLIIRLPFISTHYKISIFITFSAFFLSIFYGVTAFKYIHKFLMENEINKSL